MFKKITSIILATMMVSTTAVVAANAAEAEDAAVAADDSSVVAAADDQSAVGASDDQSTVAAAEDTASTAGAGNKVYFKLDPSVWKSAKQVTCYVGTHNGGDAPFAWGSKKGNCEDEGDNLWSYDFDDKGISIESGKQYSLNFTGDWGVQTCDMLFDSSIMGSTCVLTSETVENNVDSNKLSYVCTWEGQDSSKYGPVKLITSIGNVIGTAYWADTTPYDMLLTFIKSDGKDGLSNALNFNGKTAQQTLDDTAKALGLTSADIQKAIKESGKPVDWKNPDGGNGGGSSSGGNSSSGGSSSSGSSSSSSSSTTKTTSTSTTGTSSVKSGEGETLVFLFGGVMLAAAGIIFLARKKREE
ncbi:MAG: LPXTG cell wall anchor domain-containing protein [Ruminococcus sp.]|nr:LPXTG cell wall anchor domain-containing protein [Ruminococcus sp.]